MVLYFWYCTNGNTREKPLTLHTGIFTSYWVDYAVSKRISTGESKQWQIPIGLQLIPAALLGFGMLTLKESVRWLTKKGRHDEAWESLKWSMSYLGHRVSCRILAQATV